MPQHIHIPTVYNQSSNHFIIINYDCRSHNIAKDYDLI